MKKTKNKAMKKEKNTYLMPIILAVLMVLALFSENIAGLFQSDFEKELRKLDEINEKFDTDMYGFPETMEEDSLLLDDLTELTNIEVTEPFKLLLDIRLKLVESDVFFKEGWKHGRGSTTKWGFGCRKGLPRLRNATFNRDVSSQVGYEATALMNKMIEKYPKEAGIADVTAKQVLFLNASFSQEEKDAKRDRSLVESACVKDEDE